MQNTTAQNKATITRFNKEFIEGGNQQVFHEIIATDVVNRTAPEGSPNGKDGMFYFLEHILRKGFPDLTVEILDQVAEGDKVTTRKAIRGTHLGEFLGVPASNKTAKIDVIDIVRLENGQYKEHWGMSNIAELLGELAS